MVRWHCAPKQPNGEIVINQLSELDIETIEKTQNALFSNLITRGLKFRFAVVLKLNHKENYSVSRIMETILEEHAYRYAEKLNLELERDGIVGSAEVFREFYR
jgi:hypothetical protein